MSYVEFHRWLFDTFRDIFEVSHLLGIVALSMAILTVFVVSAVQILEDYWHAKHP